MIHDTHHLVNARASYMDASKFKCRSFWIPFPLKMAHILSIVCIAFILSVRIHIHIDFLWRRTFVVVVVVDKIKGVRVFWVCVWFLMEVIQNKQKIGILLRLPIPIPFTVVIGCGRQSYWMPSNKWLIGEQHSIFFRLDFGKRTDDHK